VATGYATGHIATGYDDQASVSSGHHEVRLDLVKLGTNRFGIDYFQYQEELEDGNSQPSATSLNPGNIEGTTDSISSISEQSDVEASSINRGGTVLTSGSITGSLTVASTSSAIGHPDVNIFDEITGIRINESSASVFATIADFREAIYKENAGIQPIFVQRDDFAMQVLGVYKGSAFNIYKKPQVIFAGEAGMCVKLHFNSPPKFS
jgi:hypothetical protein